MGKRNSSRLALGQSLLEVAFGFMVLLVLVSGILDFGRLYFIFVAMEDGAGDAAIYLASVNPLCQDDTYGTGTECADPNNALWRARNSGGELVDWSTAIVSINVSGSGGIGDEVDVRITYPVQLLTPIVPPIAGLNPLPLTAHASETIVITP